MYLSACSSSIGASQFLDFFRQIVYGALSLIAQPLFLKGAQHCHGQARQPVFENIIHSALLDAFDRADVAESSGDQNQRDVQLFIAQNVQRFQSPPLGEVVVGEHYLVRVGSYSRGKFFFCFDNIHGERAFHAQLGAEYRDHGQRLRLRSCIHLVVCSTTPLITGA